MKPLNGIDHPTVSQSRRALVTLACATAVATCPAQAASVVPPSDVVRLARELGLGGSEMRQVAVKLLVALGPELADSERAALVRRLRASCMQRPARADAARMWIRDDFAHGRLVDVDGVRFARTEVALLVALLD